MQYNAFMPYLVDGHNLILHIGLRLDDLEDELQLIQELEKYCRRERKHVDVFFDGAPPGQAGTRKLGAVTAHFVHAQTSADAAIVNTLKRLGRVARNWTVVSSDRQVQTDAKAYHAQVLTSEAFARQIRSADRRKENVNRAEPEISDEEVAEWLETFGQKKTQGRVGKRRRKSN